MQKLLLLLPLTIGCEAGKLTIDTGVGPDSQDSDADSDTDTDADSDADSDTDTDTDTEPVVLPDITVDCEGGADYRVIQEAIDASVTGDIISVAPCTYRERLFTYGKSIEVYGTDGSEVTIVDAEFGGTLLNVEDGEGAWTRFAGFTFTGGTDTDGGAAVELYSSALDLEDIVITGCDDGYAMIHSLVGWLDLTDVTIVDNDFVDGGAAIYADGGSLTARRLTADCDEDGWYALYQHNASLLDETTLTCANGYGFYSYHGELNILRSTVTGGIAGVYTEDEDDTPSERALISNSAIGGGAVGLDARYVHVELTNSVLWGGEAAFSYLLIDTASDVTNSVFTASACGISGDGGSLGVTYSAFWDNAADTCTAVGTPTVSADPLFTDFPDDLSLQTGSPLIDAGHPSEAYNDADGSRNDIGRWGGPLP